MKLPVVQIESAQIGAAEVAADQRQGTCPELRAFAQRRTAQIEVLQRIAGHNAHPWVA